MKSISFIGVFTLILGLASTGLGSPLAPRDHYNEPKRCYDPIVRKEWRCLSRSEKKDYIDAVKCLHTRPPISINAPGALSRFEDFMAEHIRGTQALRIHYVGQFLPWHRYFLILYEKALREECGYEGGQPYWDWSLDYKNFANSEMWDPDTGFGGNGPPVFCAAASPVCVPGGSGGGCVSDGPFKDFKLHLGPGFNLNRTERCLTRDFNEKIADTYYSPEAIDLTFSQKTYNEFRQFIEGILKGPNIDFDHLGQHGGGHVSIGGVMVDLWGSPGDPMFFMLHGQIDKVWWEWQQIDNRMYEMAGPIRNYTIPSRETTLDDIMDVGDLGPGVPIRDVMNIYGSYCYTYE